MSKVEEALLELVAREREIELMEQQLAEHAEAMTLDQRVQQAERLGRTIERERCLALLDDQLETLSRNGMNALILKGLRRAISDDH